MRCIHAVRSLISVWRIRARERHWRTCSGGIHASGSRPSASNSRSQRASSRSVLARRLRPRSALVSTGSARCGVAPAAASASHTNSQPVHASTATSISRPAKRAVQRVTAAGVESIRPRVTSPVSVSTASKVICARCTSNPATIAIRASSEAPVLPPRASLSRRAEEALAHAIFAQGRIRGRIARVDDWLVHSMKPGPTELAVENERLQRALRARLEEEQALRRVATLVARQHAPEAALALVTEEVARHLHASAAATVRYDDPDHATVVATWTAPGVASFTLGRQIEIVAGTPLAPAQRPRAPARGGSPATGERGGAPGMAA